MVSGDFGASFAQFARDARAVRVAALLGAIFSLLHSRDWMPYIDSFTLLNAKLRSVEARVAKCSVFRRIRGKKQVINARASMKNSVFSVKRCNK